MEAARSALALVVLLVLGVAAPPLAQAQTFTLLHSFAGGPTDGAFPAAGLLMDRRGNLYGTTGRGGSSGRFGTVFKLDPSGTLTVLHNFAGGPTDGAIPLAGLLMDARGNLYGTTEGGGSSNAGTVFKLTP